ncbi:MAG: phospho-N-acetylmuramoyl-pentapeptide-transferase, partial [Nannocystaceae bacterium]
MLYQLLFSLHDQFSWLSWLNVLRYTSTRILLATLTALLLSLVLYPWFIRTLQKIQLGQVVREDGPESHFSKRGTPTMGGSLILFCVIIPTVLWSNMDNNFVVIATLVTAATGVVGFLDDALKVRRKSSGGMPGRVKFLCQVVIAGLASWYLFDVEASALFDTCAWYPGDMCSVVAAGDESGTVPANIRYRLALPFVSFYKTAPYLPMGLYLGFTVFVIVAFSNAVNLTDGLDGLAIGPVIVSAGAFLVLTYAAGTLIAGFDIAR